MGSGGLCHETREPNPPVRARFFRRWVVRRRDKLPEQAKDQRQSDPVRSRLRAKASAQNSELRAQLTLYFLDAQTGEGVRGATVSFAGEQGRTDRAGRVCFSYPSGDLMNHTLKAHFERSAYVSFDAELKFMAGALFFNRFSVRSAEPLT